jgi:hypothetical protein
MFVGAAPMFRIAKKTLRPGRCQSKPMTPVYRRKKTTLQSLIPTIVVSFLRWVCPFSVQNRAKAVKRRYFRKGNVKIC